jgi:hypothetical protein
VRVWVKQLPSLQPSDLSDCDKRFAAHGGADRRGIG